MGFYDRLAELERENARFVVATVVARQSPVSSHLGDRALVFEDGHMEGFVGGSCSRDIVRRHALSALRMRAPVLLQIRPLDDRNARTPADADPGARIERVVVPMSCASEGAVDVYIEPHVPQRCLVVAGFTPVADALARVAAALDYAVVRVVTAEEMRDMRAPQDRARRVEIATLGAFLDELDESARHEVVAVVASQGHYDERVLEILMARDIGFIGLLASRRRAETVYRVLAQQGVSSRRLATINNPVGLDIAARSPGEVAISILAQVIAAQPTTAPVAGNKAAPAAAAALDPVCGMDVEPALSAHRFEHAGQIYVFCCAGCRTAFAAEPERYVFEPQLP